VRCEDRRMKARFLIALSLVSASALAALVSACGGGDNTALDGGNDATTGDAQSDAAGDAVANDGGGGNDANPGDGGCAKGPACRTCCTTLYPDAAAFLADNLRTCACTTPGDCKAQNVCGGNLCNGGQPSPACDGCLGRADAGDCTAKAITACAGNSECTALLGCVAACGGPTDAGGGG
jgi:hypothetical protein